MRETAARQVAARFDSSILQFGKNLGQREFLGFFRRLPNLFLGEWDDEAIGRPTAERKSDVI